MLSCPCCLPTFSGLADGLQFYAAMLPAELVDEGCGYVYRKMVEIYWPLPDAERLPGDPGPVPEDCPERYETVERVVERQRPAVPSDDAQPVDPVEEGMTEEDVRRYRLEKVEQYRVELAKEQLAVLAWPDEPNVLKLAWLIAKSADQPGPSNDSWKQLLRESGRGRASRRQRPLRFCVLGFGVLSLKGNSFSWFALASTWVLGVLLTAILSGPALWVAW